MTVTVPSQWNATRLWRLSVVAMVVTSVVTAGVATTAHADEPNPAPAAPPGADEVVTDQYGNWSIVGAAPGGVLTQAAPGADPVQTATAILNDYTAGLGITDNTNAFVAQEPRTAQDGGPVVRYAQTVSGIPVFGSGVAVRLTPDNAALSVSSSIVPTARTTGMDLAPTIDQNQAIELARTAIPRNEDGTTVDAGQLTATTPEMMIYDGDLIGGDPNEGAFNGARLVWSLSLANPVLGLSYRFLVDAVEPAVLLTFNETPQAVKRNVCDYNNTTDWEECRTEGDPAVPGRDELNHAYDIASEVYDYFQQNFGRDSFDNAGSWIDLRVRYCGSSDECPMADAYWEDFSRYFYFGAGYANADDIVAHEFTHAITAFEARFLHYAESGAIDESIADVFGEFVDQKYDLLGTDSPNTKWLIGEDLSMTDPVPRNMADPPAAGDPDRMLSPKYHLGSGDEYGVHTNSGVNNKAAYLLAHGGTFNGQRVGKLGNTKTAAIYYEALTSVLRPGSDYLDLYSGLQRACKNLIGTTGITSANCEQVKKAVTATEMNQARKRRRTASKACTKGVRNELLVDDAESGTDKWVSTSFSDKPDWRPTGRASQSGRRSFFAPSNGFTGRDWNYPSLRTKTRVRIPFAGSTYLWFDHSFRFDTFPSPDSFFAGGRVEYSLDGKKWHDLGPMAEANGYNGKMRPGNLPWAGRKMFGNMSRGFQQTRVSLDKLRGKQILIRFRMLTRGGDGWYIDDINVYNCAIKPNFSSGFQQITPQRLIDTRSDAGLVKSKGIRPAGSVLKFNAASLPIFKRGHTPTALNLTVTMAGNTGPGHVTVYPCGTRPTTSTLNATSAGLIVVNTATIPIAANGDMCIYNHAKTHLIVDVAGYQTSTKGTTPPSRYLPLTPRRLIDTRKGEGLVKVKGRRGAGSVLTIDIAPLGIYKKNTTPRALDLTITAANNAGPGHVTAYPCGKRPNTTVLNTYRASQLVSNTATVPVSGTGKLCIYTHMATDLIIDISGYYSPTQGPKLGIYRPITPNRVLDTRNDDGLFANKGIRPAGSTLKINLNKLGIHKSGQKPTAYDLTFTMILNQQPGHITVYPCGKTKPTAATMTAAEPGMVIANTATIPVNESGEICVYTHAATHLTIDVTGYHYT